MCVHCRECSDNLHFVAYSFIETFQERIDDSVFSNFRRILMNKFGSNRENMYIKVYFLILIHLNI